MLGLDIFVNLRSFFGGFDLLGLVLDLKLRLDFDFELGFDLFVNLSRIFWGF